MTYERKQELQNNNQTKEERTRPTFSDTRERNDHGEHPRLNVIHSIDRIAQSYKETKGLVGINYLLTKLAHPSSNCSLSRSRSRSLPFALNVLFCFY